MSDANKKKKIEKWFLNAARGASTLIPDGQIECFEEPDFKITTAAGPLGIEVTELIRIGEGPFSPVEEERFHSKVIEIAKADYYRPQGAIPMRVNVYFSKADGGKRDKREMAGALVAFVKSHPVGNFSRRDGVPTGFDHVGIYSEGDDWTHGESGSCTVSEIYEQLASSISAKNKLLPTYRTRLPHSPIWLLIYSGVGVPRGLSIPHGLDEWKCPFGFERVLFFAQLSGAVVEIRRSDSGKQ